MARYTTPEDIKSRFLAGSRLFRLSRSPELLLELARAKEPAAAYNPIGRHCCDRAALAVIGWVAQHLSGPDPIPTPRRTSTDWSYSVRSKFRVGEG